MTALVTVSINYCDYHGIMPDYPGRFFLMDGQRPGRLITRTEERRGTI